MTTRMDDEEDVAVRWAIRLDGEPLSMTEQQLLDSWLCEREQRRGTLLRAQAALAYLDRGRALLPRRETCADETVQQNGLALGRRGFLIGGGALGGLMAASLAGFLLFTPQAETLSTRVGEIRRVPLPDGSAVSLNTNSLIAVDMAKNLRNVTLEQGEAWFQVAHDKSRPFVVRAGDVRVEAVGTAFSVRRRGDGTEILVTEGVVRAWLDGHEAAARRLAAGSRALIEGVDPAIQVDKAPDTIDRALAWRSGEIALDGESLGYAVGEINRYNQRKIVIDDASLAKEPLVGYFRTNEPDNFGRAVAEMMGARVVEQGDSIHLVRAPPELFFARQIGSVKLAHL